MFVCFWFLKIQNDRNFLRCQQTDGGGDDDDDINFKKR